jgi:hypothetical protein
MVRILDVNLKPQDVLVALKLAVIGGADWSYPSLSEALKISQGEAHISVKRLTKAKLYNDMTRLPIRAALEEFLIHGVKYAFPVERGGVMRGIPTAWAVSPLKEKLIESNELPPVWLHPEGTIQGQSWTPLYASVPDAALKDPALHQMLALLDAIRGGSARERNLAVDLLRQRLHYKPETPLISQKVKA